MEKNYMMITDMGEYVKKYVDSDNLVYLAKRVCFAEPYDEKRFIQIMENARITMSWGSMFVYSGNYLDITDPSNIVAITAKEFKNSYTLLGIGCSGLTTEKIVVSFEKGKRADVFNFPVYPTIDAEVRFAVLMDGDVLVEMIPLDSIDLLYTNGKDDDVYTYTFEAGCRFKVI